MSKEMIVSVNGREKKIAIIENGLVTEFYIERGESNEAGQGIVGNIYKGRVMRVLPGMQSAFVDIGLERDAFLYVSDFFDEEEEFERIVVEPIKGVAVAAPVARETPAARTAPMPTPDGASATEPARATATSPRLQADARAGSDAEATLDADTRGRRGRRRRGRGDEAQDQDGRATSRVESRAATAGQTDETEDVLPARREEQRQRILAEEIATPFVAPVADFERIVDPEEAATADGEMLKDAMMQERLTDQIRRIEFDIEEEPARTIGSLLNGANSGTTSFERITDSDAREAAQAETLSAGRTTPEVVAASISSFDDAAEETPLQPAASFERISDDEGSASQSIGGTMEAGVIDAPTTDASATDTNVTGVRGRRSRGGRGGKRQVDANESRAAVAGDGSEQTQSAEMGEVAADRIATSDEASANESGTKKRRGTSSAGATKTARKSGTKKTDAGKTVAESSSTGASRSRRNAAAKGGKTSSAVGGEAATESGESFTDAEASVKTSPTRGEFARRRRRSSSGGNRRPESATEGETNDTDVATIDETAVALPNDEAILEVEDVAALPAEDVASVGDEGVSSVAVSGNGGEPSGGSGNRRESRGGREKRDGRDNRDNRNGRGGRERPPTPTIADLLREGQEILVQIAKEPISQKGARITSHIALPGRFLVYMPTVEHVGVSRKIESDSERQRLRKLIAAIRNEEDVPSGGFIVRTAGTGITEQDLREDARYLVRTWRDIRKTAERTKAPTAVHKDLDLVQRILRDQLSEDFTAIRVDSEEEYLQIAEFINRIQPRLVNRVKLYTREEPILETYGVQAEIDKAIKPRVWLRSGGYLVINQTEALVAIDVNTGKFVGRGGSRLEDTITKTNLEAVDEIARQIRLRDLGGIIVLDLIDMEERRNRQRVMQALQEALENDKSPNKVLSFNDFGLVIMTRKRVKQSLERTLCAPCPYCQGAGLVKSPQTIVYEIFEEARRLARGMTDTRRKSVTLRVHPEVARSLRTMDRDVLREIEDHLGVVDITSDESVHQEQFDFAFV